MTQQSRNEMDSIRMPNIIFKQKLAPIPLLKQSLSTKSLY